MNRLSPLAPEFLADEKTGDAAQPGPQPGRLAQVRQLFPGGHESFLGEVFALAHVAGGAIRQRGNQGLIPFNNLAEGLPVSTQAFGHQFGIVEFRSSHCFGCHHITR